MMTSVVGSCTDREEDYRFLHSMLMEKKLHLLFKIHEQLRQFEKRSPVPVQQHAMDLASDLFEDLMHHSWTNEVKALAALFSKPHFKSLLYVHDAVAQRAFQPTLPTVPDGVLEEDEDSVKIVSLVKTKEPLGATIKKDESTGAIVVARVMRGSAAEKSGLIHEGDELKEVNGVSLEDRKPKEILPLLARSQGEVTFTIVPAFKQEDPSSGRKLFVRALFDYDPSDDPTVPCKDATLAFKWGDILQIVDNHDDAWWQACQAKEPNARAGLIPSQQLHERRVALQRPKALFNPRRLKSKDDRDVSEEEDDRAISGIHIAGLRRSFRLGRKSSWVKEAACSRRWSSGVHVSLPPPTYIEVIPYVKDPAEQHRLVVLVGPSGVGVNELKRRLLLFDPDRYAVALPYTTREPKKQEKEGTDYRFVSLHKFEEDILSQRFIEYGHYSGHYYGISLDSVKQVRSAGKVCLLDIHPSKIKHVYSSEFKPYVVFVKPPRIEELRLTRQGSKFISEVEGKNPVRDFSEEDFEDMIYLAKTMEAQYGRLFDKVIVNGDVAAAFRELKADLKRIEEADIQWFPTEWIRSSPTRARKSCGHVSGWI